MPKLTQVNITTFRNIRSASILPGEAVNLILGANGSGKTSLLEAISVLAHGRSFRTHKYRRLITEEERAFTLFASVENEQTTVAQKLGIKRGARGDSVIRIDGRSVNSSAELAQHLPLLVMNSNSFQLLEGSSKYRRQFFDWLVFHVKHDFKQAWKDYVRCLKHRNSLLRRGKISTSELRPWDREVGGLGLAIEGMRKEVFELYQPIFDIMLKRFPFCGETSKTINLSYQTGWKEENAYEEQLADNLERDIRLGHTSIGSHRSDLKICLDKIPVNELLSRGQQKSVIISMFLAEATLFQQITKRDPIFLLDDLPAELDRQNLKIVGQAIVAMGSQVFVTSIEPEVIAEEWDISGDNVRMFHVKHGEIGIST